MFGYPIQILFHRIVCIGGLTYYLLIKIGKNISETSNGV